MSKPLSRATRARSEGAAPEAIVVPLGAAACGPARPAQPMSVLAEDFSLLIRTPRRMRIARGIIHVLS